MQTMPTTNLESKSTTINLTSNLSLSARWCTFWQDLRQLTAMCYAKRILVYS